MVHFSQALQHFLLVLAGQCKVFKYKPIVKSYLFPAASLNYLKLLEYSCNHLLNFDENQSLKHVKNVKSSEVQGKWGII